MTTTATPPTPTVAEGGTSWRARTREGRFALALLAPSIIVVFGIVVYPILKTLYTSLFAVDAPFAGHFPWVGLDNYKFAIEQSDFWSAVLRTAYFTLVSTGFELVFGIGIALLLYAPLRGRWLFRTIVSDEYFGYGSALAYLIVLFILALAVIYIRLLRSDWNQA